MAAGHAAGQVWIVFGINGGKDKASVANSVANLVERKLEVSSKSAANCFCISQPGAAKQVFCISSGVGHVCFSQSQHPGGWVVGDELLVCSQVG